MKNEILFIILLSILLPHSLQIVHSNNEIYEPSADGFEPYYKNYFTLNQTHNNISYYYEMAGNKNLIFEIKISLDANSNTSLLLNSQTDSRNILTSTNGTTSFLQNTAGYPNIDATDHIFTGNVDPGIQIIDEWTSAYDGVELGKSILITLSIDSDKYATGFIEYVLTDPGESKSIFSFIVGLLGIFIPLFLTVLAVILIIIILRAKRRKKS